MLIGDVFMTEEQVKLLCKIVVENVNRQFTKEQKEILKQAIDQAKTPQQLFEIAIASNLFGTRI